MQFIFLLGHSHGGLRTAVFRLKALLPRTVPTHFSPVLSPHHLSQAVSLSTTYPSPRRKPMAKLEKWSLYSEKQNSPSQIN
jgi:hypothetical protein